MTSAPSPASPDSAAARRGWFIALALIAAVAVVLIPAWLTLGFFRYAEHPWNTHLFLKHRPSFKLFFNDPTGEDSKVFTPAERDELAAYEEFVSAGGGYRRVLYTWTRQ